ncbi:MAG: 3-phosphoshikimate 1-carboxyvinyltransferase [Phycisphaerales bacterium]
MPLPTVLDIADLPVDRLPEKVLVPRLQRPFDVTIRPPGSKSITNRALLLAALAEGESVLRGALVDADDAQVMIAALEQLGATIRIEQSGADAASGSATLRITGVAGRWKPRERDPVLNLHNAGTATRFLAAAAILSEPAMGPVTIDGNARMRERPIGELIEALRALGVRAEYVGREGVPPVKLWPIAGRDLRESLVMPTTSSSQFISALLLIAPFLERGLVLEFVGAITSEPYVHMTRHLLEAWGVPTDDEYGHAFHIGAADRSGRTFVPGRIVGREFTIEPDASGAAPFLAAAALVPGSRVRVPGVCDSSIQGDARFAGVLSSLGATALVNASETSVSSNGPLSAGTVDLVTIPDTAMVAAVVACFAAPARGNPETTSTLGGLRTLRVKETDRLAALQAELSKLGAKVEIVTTRDDEALRITPPRDLASSPVCLPAHGGASAASPLVEFDTYDDHRMAMSLALIGLRRGNVVIRDPACVRKTYPTYWRDLAKLYGS